jgi:hypothetical protein
LVFLPAAEQVGFAVFCDVHRPVLRAGRASR